MTTGTKARATNIDEYIDKANRLISLASITNALAFKPRPSDIIISPYPKCGTTWVQQIVHCLRTRGDMNFTDIAEVIPWLEPALDLGQDLNAEQRAQPRAFKSHLDWTQVPKGGKYIVVLRNPKDALLSFYRFVEGWIFDPGCISLDEYAAHRFFGDARKYNYWEHFASWWGQRRNPNVLLLSYEGMKTNLPATVDRIATFIGIPEDATVRSLTVERASFNFMKRHSSMFDELLMRKHSETACDLPTGVATTKLRAGVIGGHQAEMSASLQAMVDAAWQKEITPRLGLADYESSCVELAYC